MKRIVILILVLLIVISGGGYFYLTQKLGSRAVPDRVLGAENALASVGTIAIASMDVEHVHRMDDFLNGGDADSSLFAPASESQLLGDLIQQGINPIKQTSYILAALNMSNKRPNYVFVLLGDYSENKIKDQIRQQFIVDESKDDFWIVKAQNHMMMNRDTDPCNVTPKKVAKKANKKAVYIANNRIIVTTPEFMPIILKRFAQKASADVELKKWREFRENKVVAAAIIAPKQAKQGAVDFASSVVLRGASKQPLDAIYAGAEVSLLPMQGLKINADMHATNAAWPLKVKTKYDDWASQATIDLEAMPTLASLITSLSVQADQKILHVQAAADKETVANLKKIPAEFMGMMFSGTNIKISDSVDVQAPVEETIAAEDIHQFKPQFSFSSIPAFDAEKSFHKPDFIAGAFGIFIKEISVLPADSSTVELTIRAEGTGFENLSREAMHRGDDGNSAILKILSVEDDKGNDLLRDERCKKEGNLAPKDMNVNKDQSYEDGKWVIKSQEIDGNKAVRLKKNVTLAQIANIKGEIVVDAASQVKTETINVPFAGKKIVTDAVRMLLKSAKDGTLSYNLKGKLHHILAINAKNSQGQYLASSQSGAYGAAEGKSVTKEFKGKIASIEVSYAVEMESKTYPFEISKPIEPKYGKQKVGKQPSTKSSTKAIFLKKYPSFKYKKDDCKGKEIADLSPFLLCLNGFDKRWGRKIGAEFTVYAPADDSLIKNMTSIEATIDTIIDKNGNEIAFNKQGSGSFDYLSHDTKYNKETKIWEKINRRLRTSNLSVYSEDKADLDIEAAVIKGVLKIKLPKKLKAIMLKADALGKTVKSKSGMVAKISKFGGFDISIDLQGPVEKIVQLRARAADGTVLNTGNDRITKKAFQTWAMSKEEKAIIAANPETWEGMITIYGKPKVIDIIYTDDFDVLEYPFEFKID